MKRVISVTLLAGLAILILVYLGLWQWARAHEKEAMIAQQMHYEQIAPNTWSSLAALPKQYERVKIHGIFLSPVFLLDNQYSAHQWGYHVLSPFKLDSGTIVIIDRGWLKGDPTRQSWPDIKILREQMFIQGQVYYPSTKQWVLSEGTEVVKNNNFVIESLRISEFSKRLGHPVLPFVIRLDKPSELCYVRDWPVVSMAPVRHYAYAWQWFGLALLVFIYWGYYVSKKA